MKLFHAFAEYMTIAWICSGRVIWPLAFPLVRSPMTNDPILIPILEVARYRKYLVGFLLSFCIFLLPSPFSNHHYHVQYHFYTILIKRDTTTRLRKT